MLALEVSSVCNEYILPSILNIKTTKFNIFQLMSMDKEFCPSRNISIDKFINSIDRREKSGEFSELR